MSPKETDLHVHVDGGTLLYDHLTGMLEMHDEHDRNVVCVPIGPVGLVELASRAAALAASLMEGQP